MSSNKDYTFENGAPDILDKTMTVAEFYDLLTDAWLESDMAEGAASDRYRRSVFYRMDKKIMEKFKS
jgi:hypothetical protein